MSKEDLINLGFEKIIVTTTQSDNDTDYYYYQIILTDGITLFVDVEKEMIVRAYDIPKLVITDVELLKLFITITKSCLAEN